MVERAVAWSPGHISGYFRRCTGPDGAVTGSIGGGVVIAEGVKVEAVQSEFPRVRVCCRSPGGAAILAEGSPPVEYLMARLGVSADLTTTCSLPIGAGFGLSAAALLASGAALSALFRLELSRACIASVAHDVEVCFRTGLGDVAAEQGGGVVVRRTPGIDGEILRHGNDAPLWAVSFGPIPTRGVLDSDEAMARVRTAFPGSEPHGLAPLVTVSRGFTEASGLVTRRVRAALAACDEASVPASMTMLGDGVFAIGEDAPVALAPFGHVFRLAVSSRGFCLLEGDA
ncbi:MAG: GHMP kinase [Methanoregulaceae archaeon]